MTVNTGGGGGGGRSGRVASNYGFLINDKGNMSGRGSNGTFSSIGTGAPGSGANDGGAGGEWGTTGGAAGTQSNGARLAPGAGGFSLITTKPLSVGNTLYTTSVNYSSKLTTNESFHSIEFLGNFKTNAINNVYSFRITSYNIANFWFANTNITATSNAFSRKGSVTLNVGTLAANTMYPIRLQFGTDATTGNIKLEISESNATFNKAYTVNTNGYLFSTSNTGYVPGLEMKRYSGFYNQNNAFFVPANDWTANANNFLTPGNSGTIQLPYESAAIGQLYYNIGNPTFVSFSANSISTGSVLNVAKPAGVQVGDMMVAVIHIGSSTATPTLPTGFVPFFNSANGGPNDITTANSNYFFGYDNGLLSTNSPGNQLEGYRIVTGSEPSFYDNMTLASGGSGVIFAVRNANTIFAQTRLSNFSAFDYGDVFAYNYIASSIPIAEQFIAFANQLSVFVTTAGPPSGSVTNMTAVGTDSFTYTKGPLDTTSKQPIGIGYKTYPTRNNVARIEVTPTSSSNNDKGDIYILRRFNFF